MTYFSYLWSKIIIAMRRRSEDSIYTYTVYSNCEGGSVSFNSQPVGVIKGGVCIVELTKKDSFIVRINGGLPSDSTFTRESYTQYTTDRSEYNLALSDNASVVTASRDNGNNLYFIFHLGLSGDAIGVVERTDIQQVCIQPFTEVYLREYRTPSSQVIYPGGSVNLEYSHDDIQQETIMGEPEVLREIRKEPVAVNNFQPLRMIFEPGGRCQGYTWLIDGTSVDFSNFWFAGVRSFTANRASGTAIERTSQLDVYIKCIIDDFIYINNEKIALYKEIRCLSRQPT